MNPQSTPKYTTAQLLRYPLVFGGILAGLATAFIYRETIFGDLEEERRRIFKGDQENKGVMRHNIVEVNKIRMKE